MSSAIPFYVYAWIATVSSALIIIVTKLTSKYSIQNPWLFNFLWSIIILLFTIPPALKNHAGMPQDWMPIVIAAVFSSLWYVLYIFSMYKIDVSTLSPLFNFRTVFAVLLGTLFLREQLVPFQLLLFGIITIAGMFATIDEKLNIRSFFKPSIAIGLLAMLFLALNNAAIKMALVNNDLWTATLWMGIINFAILIPTIPLFYKDLFKIKFNHIIPIGLMGIFQTVTNYSANTAYGVNISITSLIMAVPVSMILVFLLAIFKPNLLEKHSVKVYAIRFISAIIMIISALKLTA